MKKRKSHGLIFILCLLLVASGFAQDALIGTRVNAASKNAEAKEAFRQYLAQDQIPWAIKGQEYPGRNFLFRYIEMGAEEVPVLLVSYKYRKGDPSPCHAEGYVFALQYIGGKIKIIRADDWFGAVYPKSGILGFCYMGGGVGEAYTKYYELNRKGKFKPAAKTVILQPEYENMRSIFGKDKYRIKSKAVSKQKFQRWLNKKTGNEQGEIYESGTGDQAMYVKNTKKNRNSFLK